MKLSLVPLDIRHAMHFCQRVYQMDGMAVFVLLSSLRKKEESLFGLARFGLAQGFHFSGSIWQCSWGGNLTIKSGPDWFLRK